MLISKELAKAFNEQIGHEFGASMQYVSIAAHFSARHLKLLAKLFFEQAEEERQHAMKFVNYLQDGDLKSIMKSKDVPTVVSTHARRMLMKKGKI